MKLTTKQARFCHEYMIDLNATQSAIRAGYSPHTAKEIGCENLTKPHIQAEVERMMSKKTDELDITIEDIVKQIWGIAKDSEDDNTRLKGLDMMMKHTGGYASVEIKQTEPTRVILERINS